MDFKAQFEKRYTYLNPWPSAVSGLTFASGLFYQSLPEFMHVLPKAIDLPLRYNLASVAGAACINFVVLNSVSGQLGERAKRFSSAEIAGSAVLASAGIAMTESMQGQLPGRHFDPVDCYGGISAIFLSAAMVYALSKKDCHPQTEKTKTPIGPSAPGPE